MAPEAPIFALARITDRAARASERLLVALGQGDVRGIRSALWEWRKHRSDLAEPRARLEDAPPTTEEEIAAARHVSQVLQLVGAIEPHVAKWLARPLSPPQDDVTTAEGAPLVADRIVPMTWDPEADIVLVIGAGGEHLVAHLVEQGQRRLLIYLPEGPERPERPERDNPPALPEGALVVRNRLEVRLAVEEFTGPSPRRKLVVPMPDPRLTDELRARAQEETQEALDALIVSRNTLIKMSRRWTLQGIANLAAIAAAPTATALREPLRGRPCVIVSAGPSLQRNIHLLPQLKGRAIVLAINRSVAALHRAGVVPDLVMTIDPSDLRYHFDGVPTEQIEAMVLATTCHPGLYELPARRRFTYSFNRALDGWVYQTLGDDPIVESGGSVACSAFALAARCNCDPIILVGQDLAYTDDRCYASGAPDGGARISIAPGGKTFGYEGFGDGMQAIIRDHKQNLSAIPLLEAPGYFGGTVRSSSSFNIFRHWFSAAAESYAGRFRMLNCTEGGAFIEHMEHIPLAQAIDSLPPDTFDLSAGLDAAMASIDPTDRRARLGSKVDELLVLVRRSASLAERCRQLADAALRGDATALRALDRAEEELKAAVAPLTVVSLIEQRQIADTTRRGSAATSLAENLRESMELYRVVEEAVAAVEPALVEARAKLA